MYAPSGEWAWAKAYAHLPTAIILDERTLRVYVTSLDVQQIGRIGFVDLDRRDPTRLIRVADRPALEVGPPGAFDEHGVNPCCVASINGQSRLYYIGWRREAEVPYRLLAGVAVNEEGDGFRRLNNTSILPSTADEPDIRSAMTIWRDKFWWGWYVSGTGWFDLHKRRMPRYVIRRAISEDGLQWRAEPGTCIAPQDDEEYGFGRPWVLWEEGRFKMWYSIRSKNRPYRLGYAESEDGQMWERRDAQVGLDRSPEGWDSEMVCYPCVIDVNGQRYMFYNGNRHGKTGFGVAVLES